MTDTLADAPPSLHSKTVATWLALLGGPGRTPVLPVRLERCMGLVAPFAHAGGRFGAAARVEFGLDDQLSWLLIPVLGFMVAGTMLQAIVYGLMPDERWHARYNAGRDLRTARTSGWAAIIGVILALLVGATVLMSTIAFSGQRYFEYQVARRAQAQPVRSRVASTRCAARARRSALPDNHGFATPSSLTRHDHAHRSASQRQRALTYDQAGVNYDLIDPLKVAAQRAGGRHRWPRPAMASAKCWPRAANRPMWSMWARCTWPPSWNAWVPRPSWPTKWPR